MDETDSKILNIIREQAKLSYRKISQRIGVSTATVMNRVRAMEKSGVIRGYHASIDYDELGYEFTAITELMVSTGKFSEMERKISVHPNVYAVYSVTGTFDMMILSKFRTRKELDKFLKTFHGMPSIERTETKIILATYKEEHIKVK